jgi:hypothetical protein
MTKAWQINLGHWGKYTPALRAVLSLEITTRHAVCHSDSWVTQVDFL